MAHAQTLGDLLARRNPGRQRLFSAPGRVNLIGEHTDYNDGLVLPLAIQHRTWVAAAERDDDVVCVYSVDAAESCEFRLDEDPPRRRGLWLDYVQGVARRLMARGLALRGADLVLKSDVPWGAGLSSSAALELSVGLALSSVAGAPVDKLALALAGQAAEREYVGTQCGPMDQYVSAFGQSGHALLLDCRSLTSEAVPLELGSAKLLVCDTLVRHGLAFSEYNVRREQCEHALDELRARDRRLNALRDVTPGTLRAARGTLPERLYRRAHHVVTENARVVEAARALETGKLERVGQLLLASHESLRHSYEVSSPEQDFVVDYLKEQAGVYGARMTGGGFGGSVVCLLHEELATPVTARLSQAYAERFGHAPKVFAVSACDGAREEAAAFAGAQ